MNKIEKNIVRKYVERMYEIRDAHNVRIMRDGSVMFSVTNHWTKSTGALFAGYADELLIMATAN